MSKVAVVYWSGTGNTQKMAEAVAEGVNNNGGEAVLLGPSEFSSAELSKYNAVAFGCPAMGAEVLEETEYEPMFADCENSLAGKKVGLFGSYGWGDGQWMRDWESRTKEAGASLIMDGIMAHETPSEDDLDQCRSLGTGLAM